MKKTIIGLSTAVALSSSLFASDTSNNEMLKQIQL